MNENSLYGQRLVGYVMDAGRSVNLDTLEDWERAAALLTKQANPLP
jgi:CMP-N-acetylneuraminic acid synthetase